MVCDFGGKMIYWDVIRSWVQAIWQNRIMTQTIYIFLIVLLIEPQFDLKKIEINGLPYRSSKEEIIGIFGEPKINFPNYESVVSGKILLSNLQIIE